MRFSLFLVVKNRHPDSISLVVFFIRFYKLKFNQYEQRLGIMLLRDHPFMSHHRVPNWPPRWTWVGGVENIRPKGEIGILKAVAVSNIKTTNRCFLYIEHEGSSYIGCLLFDDYSVCHHIAKLLQGCCNRSIAEIGDLDLSHTL